MLFCPNRASYLKTIRGEEIMARGLSDQHVCQSKEGFTLVELLVVITIIAILIALLLPAVQVAREAARRAHCANNMKQLTFGCLEHEHFQGCYPTGGWGFFWAPDPNRGYDGRQPGGWCYNILPYIEQQPLHDMGLGGTPAEVAASNGVRIATPLSVFTCPSRRPPVVLPGGCAPWQNFSGWRGHCSTCYAANSGECNFYLITSTSNYTLPGSYAQGDTPSFWTSGPNEEWGRFNGIVITHSTVKETEVTDGTSNTIILGEKMVNPDNYLDGMDGGDDWSYFDGCQDDICRGCGIPADGAPYYPRTPMQDTSGYANSLWFGSAHSTSCNMSMCDGSVRSITYTIEPETFRRLCNRMDNQPVDASIF
jgi:prepilin-type N-terminal cleavage/methylation domain-containing protein/prepilin-type processing-associated H-X9-DG protein